MPEEEGPYEIMPYKEIVKLKRELEELQKRQGEAPSRELLKSMNSLTTNMGSMLGLFKSAAEEMQIEEKAAPAEVDLGPVLEKLDEVSAKVDEMSGKFDELSSENKAIAEGIIALSDTVDEKLESLSAAPPKPPSGLPPMAPGGPIPPGAGPGGPGLPPLGPPGAGIEGSMSAAGPGPSRLPKGKWPGGPGPGGPPGLPPLGAPGPGGPPGLPPLGAPPGGPPGLPPGGPPKKKGLFTFGK